MEDNARPEMREMGYRHLTTLGESYEGPDDPRLVFFSVEKPQAWICGHGENDWNPLPL